MRPDGLQVAGLNPSTRKLHFPFGCRKKRAEGMKKRRNPVCFCGMSLDVLVLLVQGPDSVQLPW